MNWIGEHFSGMQPTDVNREVTDQVFQVKNNQLHLSRMVEWQFNNLNAPFEKLVGTSKRTVMVYTDVVESTVVGSGKFPLLREAQLLRTVEGESTVEPLQYQWIKVRGNQLEMVEVEIATPSVANTRPNAPPKRPITEPLNAYGISLDGENNMVRIGGFLKTQNRIRRQRTRGRFMSPYHVGGTIFGKSTMALYPLMYTSSRLLEPWRLTHLIQRRRRRMKGGTIFGKSTVMRMRNPLMFPVCVPGEPRALVDGDGPTPTRYKKDTPLNVVDSQHHVAQFV